MESLESRLSQLESSSKKWRGFALLQAVMLFALCAWGFAQKPDAIASKPRPNTAKPGTVTANQFVLVDNQGRVKATLNYNYGAVTFELTSGSHFAALQVSKEGASMKLQGTEFNIWAAAFNPPQIIVGKGDKVLFSKP